MHKLVKTGEKLKTTKIFHSTTVNMASMYFAYLLTLTGHILALTLTLTSIDSPQS